MLNGLTKYCLKQCQINSYVKIHLISYIQCIIPCKCYTVYCTIFYCYSNNNPASLLFFQEMGSVPFLISQHQNLTISLHMFIIFTLFLYAINCLFILIFDVKILLIKDVKLLTSYALYFCCHR